MKKSYVVGFFLSLILTLLAFGLVMFGVMSGVAAVVTLAVLALIQLFVQLVFFLHVTIEAESRQQIAMFGFAALIILIVVIGSIWIVNNLDYRMMMMPHEIDHHIMDEEGIHYH